MHRGNILLLLLLLFVVLFLAHDNFVLAGRGGRRRKPKFFSLVNIVRFSNGECGSADGGRNGTCLSLSECSNEGGLGSGTCAAGFGVCCLFDLSSCGSSVVRNCSYVRNPGFPASFAAAAAAAAAAGGQERCDYTISKCSADVCFFRLDLDSFSLRGPADADEFDGGECSVDALDVQVRPGGGMADGAMTGPAVPTICGENSGQHIYVELTPGDADESALLLFRFQDPMALLRRWQIKVTQIRCSSVDRPPSGCLQYHTSPSGRFSTFNFSPEAGNIHLANQRYSVCFRAVSGSCCVEYRPCAGVPLAFALQNVAVVSAKNDNDCNEDYLGIEASSSTCNRGPVALSSFASRFCGRAFSAASGAAVPSPVCDCTPPFQVDVVTDGGNLPGLAATRDRGVCLDYDLIPCL